jgi:hypothetical protein
VLVEAQGETGIEGIGRVALATVEHQPVLPDRDLQALAFPDQEFLQPVGQQLGRSAAGRMPRRVHGVALYPPGELSDHCKVLRDHPVLTG